MKDRASAFAPATVGNVGIGFDILGHTVQSVGDRVTAQRVCDAWRAHSMPSRALRPIYPSSPSAIPPARQS